jgi:hypothetical protein
MKTIAEGLAAFQEISERLLTDLKRYLEPYRAVVRDARYGDGLDELVAGMLGAGSPHMTKAAGSAPGQVKAPFSLAKRFYRLMGSENYSHADWLKVLQADARAVVVQAHPKQVIVALDMVNFEQAYAEQVEGISTVHKATPPGPDGKARLTSGFPTVLCEAVNLLQLAIPYAHFFSYTTPDFLSQNLEVAFQRKDARYPRNLCRDEGLSRVFCDGLRMGRPSHVSRASTRALTSPPNRKPPLSSEPNTIDACKSTMNALTAGKTTLYGICATAWRDRCVVKPFFTMPVKRAWVAARSIGSKPVSPPMPRRIGR